MNITIPEDLNRIEVIAYQIGMQTFATYCREKAEATFPYDGSELCVVKSHDLAEEFFAIFTDLADQRIRFAMDTIALHGGYATAINFQEAANRSVITMSHMMTMESLLWIKEDELVNG